MPFWATLVIGAGLMLYFPFYIEAIFLFLLSDLMFGVSTPKLFGIKYTTLIIGLILFFAIKFIKSETKFYRDKLE